MAIEFRKLPAITVHFNAAEDSPEVEYNFDPDAPRPWTPFIAVNVCDCVKHLPEGHITQVVQDALAGLRPAEQADAIARIAAGELTVDEKAACAIMQIGTTKLNDLRRSGEVPEPVHGPAGKNIWLEADIRAAYAAVLAAKAVARQSGTVRRRAPKNRYAKSRGT